MLHDYETYGYAAKPLQSGNIVKTLRQVDLIKCKTMQGIAAEQVNREFGLEIPAGKQKPLDLH